MPSWLLRKPFLPYAQQSASCRYARVDNMSLYYRDILSLGSSRAENSFCGRFVWCMSLSCPTYLSCVNNVLVCLRTRPSFRPSFNVVFSVGTVKFGLYGLIYIGRRPQKWLKSILFAKMLAGHVVLKLNYVLRSILQAKECLLWADQKGGQKCSHFCWHESDGKM